MIKRSGIEVVDRKTDKAIDFIDCHQRGRDHCAHVEKGVNINLDHDTFKTRVVVEEATA